MWNIVRASGIWNSLSNAPNLEIARKEKMEISTAVKYKKVSLEVLTSASGLCNAKRLKNKISMIDKNKITMLIFDANCGPIKKDNVWQVKI